MHLPSERVYQEMRAEASSLWYVPANGGDEIAFLIKAPTSSIKALISGCCLRLLFGKNYSHLCTGVQILDMPDAPVFISGAQRDTEEHNALIRALREKRFPVFLFNEMDICLAWSYIEIAEEDASHVLKFIGELSQMYVGPFTDEVSHSLDCFCFSVDNTITYPDAHKIPTESITPKHQPWRINNISFIGTGEAHTVTIDNKDEGEMFERAVWASLEPVFPLTLYKRPQIRDGQKMREFIDVFSFYEYGSFIIEAKDISILNAGFSRNQHRKTKGIQKQVNKGINQLIGASNKFASGEPIFDAKGIELNVDRSKPPHCIVLITELVHWGDWSKVERLLLDTTRKKRAFFHLLDLREFIVILKGSAGKPELIDYNLIERFKCYTESKSIFIRSRINRPNTDHLRE